MHLQAEPIDGAPIDTSISVAVNPSSPTPELEMRQAREEYLVSLAHDLRTPLNAISLAATVLETLFAGDDCTAEASRMLAAVRRNVLCLERLIRQMLAENASHTAETLIRLERNSFALRPLVQEIIDDLHPLTGRGSVRLINLVPAAVNGYADAGLLRRVLQNLIANAIRSTPRGEITIGAQSLEAEHAVDYWVSDNGSGIPEELIPKLFERAGPGSADEDSAGRGLGIVRTFVEAHGGSVSVCSTKGSGATFRFRLPAEAFGGQRSESVTAESSSRAFGSDNSERGAESVDADALPSA